MHAPAHKLGPEVQECELSRFGGARAQTEINNGLVEKWRAGPQARAATLELELARPSSAPPTAAGPPTLGSAGARSLEPGGGGCVALGDRRRRSSRTSSPPPSDRKHRRHRALQGAMFTPAPAVRPSLRRPLVLARARQLHQRRRDARAHAPNRCLSNVAPRGLQPVFRWRHKDAALDGVIAHRAREGKHPGWDGGKPSPGTFSARNLRTPGVPSPAALPYVTAAFRPAAASRIPAQI